MQVPILIGTGTTPGADFREALPINLEPVPLKSGLSDGYLRSSAGATSFATGYGVDRGGIAWNGVCYRVSGNNLISIDMHGLVTSLATIPGTGQTSLDYGFDRLAIAANNALYYWNGTTLTQVTDVDLGVVKDMLWMTGYYVTTDGTSIVVTDLSDPTSVNPLKYGSAEEDPDPIVALFKLRGELYALGGSTIQVYSNTGGSLFPFTANPTATVPVGCVGAHAKCAFFQTMAFVGSGRNEAPAVYFLDGGSATKISTREIDDALSQVDDLTAVVLESRTSRDERRLLVHLPSETLCYYANASRLTQKPVWSILRSGTVADQPYRLRNAVDCYGLTIVGDLNSSAIGLLDETVSTHFGNVTGWQFQTDLLYNSSKSGIIHTVELVGLPGRSSTGDPVAFMSTSKDGLSFTPEKTARIGKRGERSKRVWWSLHRRFTNYITMRFRGADPALVSWAVCQADIEPLTS